MQTVVWGLNEESKKIIDKKEIVLDFIFDRFSEIDEYSNIKVTSDLTVFKNENIKECIVASSTYFFDIYDEIKSINKNIDIVHIGKYICNNPRLIMIKNIDELQKCSYVKGSIFGEIIIKKGLILKLMHDIPVSINVDRNATIVFNDNVLMDAVEVSARETSIITFGNKSYMNKFGVIRAKESIEIGDNCAIAWNVCIMDNDGYSIDGNLSRNARVSIGSNVWIGNNVNILKNTSIDDGCIVASMSKVKGNFEKNCLIAGIPAKKEKEDVSWKV